MSGKTKKSGKAVKAEKTRKAGKGGKGENGDKPQKKRHRPRMVVTCVQLDSLERHARSILSIVADIRNQLMEVREISREEVFGGSFGGRLVAARKAAGLKQFQLARKAGTTPAQLCQVERGNVCPSVEFAVKIADVLGVSLDSLCGR